MVRACVVISWVMYFSSVIFYYFPQSDFDRIARIAHRPQRTAHGVWKSHKKSHTTLRAKRATFTFWVYKSSLKMPKNAQFGEFLKTCGQTELPDRSVLIGQKLVENVKIQMRHFGWFSNTVRRTASTHRVIDKGNCVCIFLSFLSASIASRFYRLLFLFSIRHLSNSFNLSILSEFRPFCLILSILSKLSILSNLWIFSNLRILSNFQFCPIFQFFNFVLFFNFVQFFNFV